MYECVIFYLFFDPLFSFSMRFENGAVPGGSIPFLSGEGHLAG